MSFVSFATSPTSIPVSDSGIFNGYKVSAILHGGRKIDLSRNTYYYIPFLNRLVTYRGSKAKFLTATDGKYNFIEKFDDRPGHWAFKIDSQMFHADCNTRFH